MKKLFFLFAAVLLFHFGYSQNLHGLATGNYAGIAGLQFNPASIVDSRYKFDLNIAAGQYSFGNNYLNMKPGVFVRRLFQKDPYNSSWQSVTQDLISPISNRNAGRVRTRVAQNFQLPLSMMITTGKRSAIAINLRNRYIAQVDSLNPLTADFLYSQLRNPELFGVAMNNDGFATRFMNWQEVGFTYGRVIFNWNRHFLKAAVTAKWLGANAGANIEASRLNVTFLDSQRLSMNSPNINYARTERADFGSFNRRDFLTNLEGQSFGFDAGIVYEFRGRIGNFKYTDEDFESRLRRDKNKYTLRIGVALNDVGVVQFDNRLPLTRNHSANITNWNFGGVKANNISEWDTAYSKQVSFFGNQNQGFSIQLPTAFIANVDLHLFGGFYVNAAVQRNVKKLGSLGANADTRLRAGEWFAVTPRLESRFFGLYVPVIFEEEGTIVGATLRLGPVYVGSNNLLELIGNPQVPRADVHAGVRIPIGYGKPTKLAKAMEKQTGISFSDELDSLEDRTADLETRVAVLEQMADTGWRPTVIVNNFITDSLGRTNVNSQVDGRNSRSAQQTNATYTQQQIDSLNRENEKMTADVKKEMKKAGIEEPKAPKRSKSEKKNAKREARYQKDQKQYNDAVEKELKKMRKQQAITSTALVGAVTAGAVVDANASKKAPDTIRIVKTDTIYAGGTRVDTVVVRDTIRTTQAPATVVAPVVPAVPVAPKVYDYKVYFENGSASVSQQYKDLLDEVGKTIRNHPQSTVRLVGLTDATGDPKANRILAERRVNAVIQQLKFRGVNIASIERDVQVSDVRTKEPAEEKRRVDIILTERQ